MRKVPVKGGLLMLFLHEQVVWTCRVEELKLKSNHSLHVSGLMDHDVSRASTALVLL